MNIVGLKNDNTIFESQNHNGDEAVVETIKNNITSDALNAGIEVRFEEMTDEELNAML